MINFQAGIEILLSRLLKSNTEGEMFMKTRKTKTNFGDIAPLTIEARLYSVEASLVEFKLQGKGAYPYDCQHAREYHYAYIYVSESGGWIGSYQLELQSDGSYIIT